MIYKRSSFIVFFSGILFFSLTLFVHSTSFAVNLTKDTAAADEGLQGGAFVSWIRDVLVDNALPEKDGKYDLTAELQNPTVKRVKFLTEKNGVPVLMSVAGKIGLGTTSPQFLLDIHAAAPRMNISSAQNSIFRLIVEGNEGKVFFNTSDKNLVFQKNDAIALEVKNDGSVFVSQEIKENGVRVARGNQQCAGDSFVVGIDAEGKLICGDPVVRTPAPTLSPSPVPQIYTSCLAILDAGESTGDGTYTIDPDGEGGNDPFQVYCDMTTDGGGWINLKFDQNTTIDDLKKIGDTSQIESTFYTDPEKGIGWGSNNDNWSYKNFLLNDFLDMSETKITFSGSYNTPSGGLGSLSLSNGTDSVLTLGDAWTFSGSGQSLSINGNYIFEKSKIDVLNRTETLGPITSIGMMGYTSSYGYTKRYIKELSFR
jgi:hypothetical protein